MARSDVLQAWRTPCYGPSVVAGLRRLCAFALLLLAGAVAAQPLQPVPALSARVVDTAQAIEPDGRARLEAQLAALEQETGAQLVLLLVATTAPEDIAAYAHRVADHWKLGRREVGDGMLLVLALQDRRIRIEVAKALEGALPDLAARRIITESITPALRRGDTVGALAAGIDRIGERIRAERLGLPAEAPDDAAPDGGDAGDEDLSWGMLILFAFPIAARLLSGVLGRKFGAFVTAAAAGGLVGWSTASLAMGLAAALAAFVVALLLGAGATLRRAGRSASRHSPVIWGPPGGFGGGGSWGGGGGGVGGGGFSSGGGGDFGGGGASGDW